MRPVLALLVFVPLLGCTQDDEVVWTQYNADDDSLSVEVGAAEVLPAVSTTVWSNTGSIEIGTATVDPGGGPVNVTTYELRVELYDEYADDVGRASVRTDSGDRGEDEYDMVADTTGQGIWVHELVALGEEGEQRTDILTFRLWRESSTATE